MAKTISDEEYVAIGKAAKRVWETDEVRKEFGKRPSGDGGMKEYVEALRVYEEARDKLYELVNPKPQPHRPTVEELRTVYHGSEHTTLKEGLPAVVAHYIQSVLDRYNVGAETPRIGKMTELLVDDLEYFGGDQ